VIRPERTLVAILLVLAACAPPPTPKAPPSPAAAREEAAGREAANAHPEPSPEVKARVEAALVAIQDRHACNRVMGCPPLTQLLQDAEAAVPAASALLASRGGSDGYWVEMLLELLGQSRDARALRPLEAFVRDRRWSPRIRALVVLARLEAHATDDTRALVAEAETMAASADDQAWLAAALYARSRLEPAASAQHRDRLAGLYPRDRAAVEAIPAPVLDWMVMIAGEARLTQAAPLIRVAALSSNRFVSVSAITVAGRLQDTGAVPYLLSRLEDRQPAVRRSALAGLQAITGMRQTTEVEAWREWARQHALAEIPGG
jgi:hypothetical protein